MPLFAAAADREMAAIAKQQEPQVAFLRKDLSARNIITCAEAMSARHGRWVYTAGLVLVRQKPGSAKGVMFINIEDETGPANIVVWPVLFEKRPRVVLGSSMMAINGRIKREGEVVHLVAQQLFDLSGDLFTPDLHIDTLKVKSLNFQQLVFGKRVVEVRSRSRRQTLIF